MQWTMWTITYLRVSVIKKAQDEYILKKTLFPSESRNFARNFHWKATQNTNF
jgi:hypothetical protein